jgi:hypothetical protein
MPLVPKLGENKNETSTLRTFRLETYVIGRLEEEANKQGSTINGLVSNLLDEYVNVTARLQYFGLMRITPNELIGIINSMEDEHIVNVASKLGGSLVKEILMQIYGAASPYYLNLYLELILCRYKGWANYASEEKDGTLEVRLGHTYGLKWTTFLCNFIDSALYSINNKRLSFSYASNYSIIFSMDIKDASAPSGFPLGAILKKGKNKQE